MVPQDVSPEMFTVNNTWMLAALENGMTRAKNTVNILFKNTTIIAIGLLTYALVGFNLMYPGDFSLGEFVEFAGFGLDPGAEGNTSAYNPGYTYYTDFIFQGMFAATAATKSCRERCSSRATPPEKDRNPYRRRRSNPS